MPASTRACAVPASPTCGHFPCSSRSMLPMGPSGAIARTTCCRSCHRRRRPPGALPGRRRPRRGCWSTPTPCIARSPPSRPAPETAASGRGAAVDGERRAVHERGLVRQQEQRRVRHLLGLTGAAERVLSAALAHQLLLVDAPRRLLI